MPIHSGTATSHGNDTVHPANIADEVEGHDNFVPFEEVQNMDTVGDSDIQDGATSRLTPVASSNCSRKRPRPDVISRKKKKKKDSVDEICSFLREIAAALRAMVKNQAQSNIAKEMNRGNASQPQPQQQQKISASWPPQISYSLLQFFLEIHGSGRGGDNGLKKEHWLEISNRINGLYDVHYDWEQCKNHFRIWKNRLRALSDLQKQSGLGWNASQLRFEASPHFWNEVKNKEQRYWRGHSVLPIHIDVAAALGNEIATGQEAGSAAYFLNEDSYSVPEPTEYNTPLDVAADIECTQTTPVGSTSRSRGRPTGESDSGQPQKKKKGVEKVVSLLKEMSIAIKDLVSHAREVHAREVEEAPKDKGQLLCEAINAIPELDLETRLLAKDVFARHSQLGTALLTEKEEDRATMIKFYLERYQ